MFQSRLITLLLVGASVFVVLIHLADAKALPGDSSSLKSSSKKGPSLTPFKTFHLAKTAGSEESSEEANEDEKKSKGGEKEEEEEEEEEETKSKKEEEEEEEETKVKSEKKEEEEKEESTGEPPKNQGEEGEKEQSTGETPKKEEEEETATKTEAEKPSGDSPAEANKAAEAQPTNEKEGNKLQEESKEKKADKKEEIVVESARVLAPVAEKPKQSAQLPAATVSITPTSKQTVKLLEVPSPQQQPSRPVHVFFSAATRKPTTTSSFDRRWDQPTVKPTRTIEDDIEAELWAKSSRQEKQTTPPKAPVSQFTFNSNNKIQITPAGTRKVPFTYFRPRTY